MNIKALSNHQKALVAFLFLVFAFLTFLSLNGASLWDDEAQVGIIARNLLRTGHLTGWDGHNLYWYRNGSLLDNHLNYINPPLDVIVASLSFRVFGVSDWALRLPFALFGLCSLAMFFTIARRRFADFPAYAILCFLPLALSVQFILFSRTGRYFTLSAFFFLLALDQYQRYLETRKIAHGFLIALACIGSFYASYLLAAASYASLIVYHLLFKRGELTGKDLKNALAPLAIFGLACIPFSLVNKIWVRTDDFKSKYGWLPAHIKLLVWNFRDINVTCCLPWTILALLFLLLFLYRKSDSDREYRAAAAEWGAIVAAYLFVVSLLSPQALDVTNVADMRYIAPILPFACGLSGVAIGLLHKRMPWISVLLLFAMTTTNALTLTNLGGAVAPNTGAFRQTLPALIDEETHPYPTANAEAVAFLRAHAKPGEVLTTIPFFEAYPIMFYLGDELTICQPKLAGVKSSPIPKDVFIPNEIFYGPQNWIISFSSQPGNLIQAARLIRKSSSYLILPNGKILHRTFRVEGFLNVYCAQTQRPELTSHEFGPVDRGNSSMNGVTLFHQIIEPSTKQEMLEDQERMRRNFHIKIGVFGAAPK